MIIGICGKKRAGKDFTGSIFERDFGFTVCKFATPLYEYAAIVRLNSRLILANRVKKDLQLLGITNIVPDYIAAHILNCYRVTPALKELEGGKPRKLLQWLGTDIFRNQVDQNYWVKIFKETLPYGKDVVVTDVRFKNEADVCDKIIRVRGGIIGDNHVSEKIDFPADYILDNTAKSTNYIYDVLEVARAIIG